MKVKKRILSLIQLWGLRFANDIDTMPLFNVVYEQLKKRKLPFGDEAIVDIYDGTTGKGPILEKEDNRVKITNLDKKHKKLVNDLRVVVNNIILTNEMIDACDPNDCHENEPLKDVVNSIRNMEEKLQSLIIKIKNDTVMNMCLLLNDDVQKTLSRYSVLRNGSKPASFYRQCVMEDEDVDVKITIPKKGDMSPPKAQVRAQPPRSIPPPVYIHQQEAAPMNLADTINNDPQPGMGQPNLVEPAADNKSKDLFDMDFNDGSTGPSNAPPPVPQGDDQIHKLTEIMGAMNMQKQQEEEAQAYQAQMAQQAQTNMAQMAQMNQMMGGNLGAMMFQTGNPQMMQQPMQPQMQMQNHNMMAGGFGPPDAAVFNTAQPMAGPGPGQAGPGLGYGGFGPPGTKPPQNEKPPVVEDTGPFKDMFKMGKEVIKDRTVQPSSMVEDSINEYTRNSNTTPQKGANPFDDGGMPASEDMFAPNNPMTMGGTNIFEDPEPQTQPQDMPMGMPDMGNPFDSPAETGNNPFDDPAPQASTDELLGFSNPGAAPAQPAPTQQPTDMWGGMENKFGAQPAPAQPPPSSDALFDLMN